MFGNAYFFNGLLRIYIAVFGKMFDDIRIQRKDASGNTIQELPVSVSYGPKEKWLRRITEDPNMTQQLAFITPRMAYEMTGLQHVPEQQTSQLQRLTNVTSGQEMLSQYKWTTYKLNFALYVQAKNEMDHFNIVEQIIPFFTPDWTMKVNTVPAMGYEDKVSTTLDNLTIDKMYEGDLDSKRVITWTLNFTMTARFYGPIYQQGPIRRVLIDLLVPGGTDPITVEDIVDTPRSVRITVTPGETANGYPTTDPNQSKPWNEINASDVTMDGQQAWAYITKIMEYDDNNQFNPNTLTDQPVGTFPVEAILRTEE
jgi:hypothetical protein